MASPDRISIEPATIYKNPHPEKVSEDIYSPFQEESEQSIRVRTRVLEIPLSQDLSELDEIINPIVEV